MLICRHQLLRAVALQRSSTSFVNRRLFADRLRDSPARGNVRTIHVPTPEDGEQAVPSPPQPPELSADAPDSFEEQRASTSTPVSVAGPVPGPQGNQEIRLKAYEQFDSDPVGNYRILHSLSKIAVKRMPIEMFEKAFNTAFRDGASEQDLDLFVQHAILVCRTSYHKRGRMPAVKILKSLKKRRCISKAQVLSLLQTLHDTDQLRFVDHDDRVNIVRAITNYPPDDELDGSLYELLSLLLTEMLSKHEAPPKDPASPLQEGEDIPAFLWPLFVIVRRLALLGRQQVASDTFSALVKRKYIHPEAIRRTDLKSRDFSYIVLSTLVRTCMLWGWFQRASFLLIPALAAAKDISRPFGELAAHWAYALLEVPSDPDLTNCASVLIQLMNYAPTYRLPDTLLQEFYAAAQRARAPELAQAVYAAARTDAVVARHPYLPPRGPPLLWLMQHLQESAKNVHLARVLAKHVVDENAPVSLHARAPFVAAVAQLGFATQARALWERYAAGVNAVVVVGNAATMLRLVSLFTHMAQRAEWALAHPHPNMLVELPAGALRRNSVRREEPGDHVEGLGADRDAAAAGYPASDAPAPHEDAEPQMSSASDAFASGAMEEGEEEGEGEEALSHPAALQAKIEDFRAFAERVLSAFYASRRPMKSATHFELNALARAAFVLGKNTLGFKVFRIMKDKFMTPDLHDVNVALSAVAKHNPADGALMLERMHKNRLQPDAVSFGTVIHWAIIHGDVPLVSSLMRKAREAGVTALSFKTMGSLLRATITMDTEGQAGDRSSLDNAQDLIHSLLDAGLVPTTNMGRDCVVAALRADDPVMAFRFWRLLIKDKVEWADAAQAKTRALIALKIRQHCTRDWLDHDKGRVMLSELGTDTAFDLRLRRAAAKTAPGGKAAPKEGV